MHTFFKAKSGEHNGWYVVVFHYGPSGADYRYLYRTKRAYDASRAVNLLNGGKNNGLSIALLEEI